MKPKIIIDTKEYDELLLDVLWQSCGEGSIDDEGGEHIDNRCTSAYENACDYLVEQGYLTTTNGRIYKSTGKENQ